MIAKPTYTASRSILWHISESLAMCKMRIQM
jgi:hypothetical protein